MVDICKICIYKFILFLILCRHQLVFGILDCGLRIADLWNRYALSIIMDRSTQKLTTGRIPSIPKSLNPELDPCPIFMQFRDEQRSQSFFQTKCRGLYSIDRAQRFIKSSIFILQYSFFNIHSRSITSSAPPPRARCGQYLPATALYLRQRRGGHSLRRHCRKCCPVPLPPDAP